MSALIKTIGSVLDPLYNLLQQIWEFCVFIVSFFWDVINGLYYGFNTLISHLWDNLQAILGYNFISENLSVFSGLAQLLGISSLSLFNSLLLCSIFLVGMRFVWSLIPFFRK